MNVMQSTTLRSILTKRLFFHGALILLLAFTMASHSPQLWPGNDWYGRIVYWAARFGIQSIVFLGCYYLLTLSRLAVKPAWALILAFLISWPIFVLTITMIDIVLGQPELDGALYADRGRLIVKMFDEFYWILPKHFFFCLLVVLINFRLDYQQLFDFRFDLSNPSSDRLDHAKDETGFGVQSLVSKLSANIREEPLRIQAQEHYIKVTTCLGSELIQYKFGQALKDLKQQIGLQVHRSFWVANVNIAGWRQQKNNIELELKFGEPVPVSRRYEQKVKQTFTRLENDR